jgi:hypothetical protein
LEPPVIVDDVSALVVVPKGRLSPATVFLLATGLKSITVDADVLAALGIRTTWSAIVVAAISITVTIPTILATICILAAISILAAIAITPLVGSIVSLVGPIVSVALKASVDVLDLSAAALIIAKLGRLPSTAAIVAGCMQC